MEHTHCIRGGCGELRPKYVVIENVANLLVLGLETVLCDLAEIGYDAEWQIISANDVGGPHLRERVWVVAYPDATEIRRVRAAGKIVNQPGQEKQLWGPHFFNQLLLLEKHGMRIRPMISEWMMGYPVSWTDFQDSETPLSLKSPTSLEGQS